MVNVRLVNKRRRLWEREGGKCFWCGTYIRFKKATTDHLLTKSEGGSDDELNLVCSCWSCNNKRGNTDYMVWATACWADKKEPAGQAGSLLSVFREIYMPRVWPILI